MAETDEPVDVSGLVAQRAQATRALEQTRQARQSGEIERAGAAVIKELETAINGEPEPGPPGLVTARVVATADAKAKVPAVPLSGLTVRLRIRAGTTEKEREGDTAGVVAEGVTDALGLVALRLPKEGEGAYDLAVLSPDGKVLASQPGRLTLKQSPVHLFEVARTSALKPQLERARPLEDGIVTARERAGLAREVAVKALEAQETRLVAYLAEIDTVLACKPASGPADGRAPSAEEKAPAPPTAKRQGADKRKPRRRPRGTRKPTS